MKIFEVISAVLWAVGLCLTPLQLSAASKYDGSV
jgi:hypothetical protein